ncbi:MAG: hypothetical protein J7601_02340 [Chloroflexi bacterium]|jgi:hypothetical protein|nr:hypothetical protein [Chloroflexota bacterium]
MLSFAELLRQLAEGAVGPSLVLLIVSAGFVVLVRNWRLVLPVMVLQYVAVGLLLARLFDPIAALFKPMAGSITLIVLSLAAQRADDVRAERGESVARERLARPNWQRLPAQLLLRAVTMALVLTAAFGAAVRFPLPGGTRELNLGAYMLIGCGLILMATAYESLNVGTGILMLVSGFELAYVPLEPSVGVSALLALTTLLIGLAIAYLILADADADISPDPRSRSAP